MVASWLGPQARSAQHADSVSWSGERDRFSVSDVVLSFVARRCRGVCTGSVAYQRELKMKWFLLDDRVWVNGGATC